MCPLCFSKNFELIGKPEVSNVARQVLKSEYYVAQCIYRNYYFVSPSLKLSPEQWAVLYNEEYFPIMTKRHINSRKKDIVKRLTTISRFLKQNSKKFLDIGCGEGYMLLETIKRGWEVTGIDIVDNRRTEVKISGINFIKSDLLSLKLPSDFYDIIYIDSVLEHVVNPAEYLSEVKRILKPGGIVYIGVPNEDCLFNTFRSLIFKLIRKNICAKIKPFKQPYHVGGFNNRSLKFAIKQNDFEILIQRNFAGRLRFLNYKFLSGNFFIALSIEPISLLSIPLRREDYLEIYVRKQ